MLNPRSISAVIVSLCICLSVLLPGSARAAELKVGVMNVQKIMTTSVAGKAAMGKLNEKMKELQDKFKAEEEELVGLQTEIEKKSTAWSEEAKQEKVLEFQKKRRDLQAKTEEARFEMKTLQETESAPIMKALEKVVDTYAKANGYSLILDADFRKGVIFFADSIDISDKLIVELDAAMAAK